MGIKWMIKHQKHKRIIRKWKPHYRRFPPTPKRPTGTATTHHLDHPPKDNWRGGTGRGTHIAYVREGAKMAKGWAVGGGRRWAVYRVGTGRNRVGTWHQCQVINIFRQVPWQGMVVGRGWWEVAKGEDGKRLCGSCLLIGGAESISSVNYRWSNRGSSFYAMKGSKARLPGSVCSIESVLFSFRIRTSILYWLFATETSLHIE